MGSMVQEPYDGIIGDAPVERSRSIDCSTLVVPSGDAPYKVILEAVMSSRGKSSAKTGRAVPAEPERGGH